MLKAIQQMNPNDFHMVFTPRAKIKMTDSINLFMELIGDDAIYTEEYNLLNAFKNDYLNRPAVK
jgi:hypothetical protein